MSHNEISRRTALPSYLIIDSIGLELNLLVLISARITRCADQMPGKNNGDAWIQTDAAASTILPACATSDDDYVLCRSLRGSTPAGLDAGSYLNALARSAMSGGTSGRSNLGSRIRTTVLQFRFHVVDMGTAAAAHTYVADAGGYAAINARRIGDKHRRRGSGGLKSPMLLHEAW